MLVHTTSLSQYPLLRRGKVRDVYLADPHILMVATDRVSAFDVIMNDAIPDKGALLTEISAFWFGFLGDLVPTHFITTDLSSLQNLTSEEREQLTGRSMIVHAASPLPIECVVRGYLAGSGWKEYQATGAVCGVPLPAGLRESEQLPEPIFTPATKAEEGHDENITFDEMCSVIGYDRAAHLRELSLALYQRGAEYAAERGLILADTKFEFGVVGGGSVMLIDEALTPDSSRYWLASAHEPGIAQQNFDKQILRDYLESLDWNKQPPPPPLPAAIVEATRDRYFTARRMLLGTRN
jgi:phosphoribosylaminoimidazole-succinocarboxamide synthase